MVKKKVRQIPTKERLGWIEEPHGHYSLNKQLALCGLGKSSFYYQPAPESDQNLQLMREIDEIYLKWPFFGVSRIHAYLRSQGHDINIKRVRRLCRIMDIQAIYQKPNLSIRNRAHVIYPYLLKHLDIDRPNQVWSVDITYVPMERGFLYKVAVIDWFSRYILSFALSNTLEVDFVIEALQAAVNAYGRPEIINTDQGSQFTSAVFIGLLQSFGIQISMDGKGRALDNVRIERYWRSYKYECVYLNSITDGWHLKQLTDQYVDFYNNERPHQNLGYNTPAYEYQNGLYVPKGN